MPQVRLSAAERPSRQGFEVFRHSGLFRPFITPVKFPLFLFTFFNYYIFLILIFLSCPACNCPHPLAICIALSLNFIRSV